MYRSVFQRAPAWRTDSFLLPSRRNPARLLPAAVAAALLVTSPDTADAQSRHRTRPPEPRLQAAEGPLTILVSLRDQRVRVYDDSGLVSTAPVSSGKPSTPTPTGIFTILQKNKEHRSNLHNDAPMPNMQRITWSGVALHAGDLPGYAASHGCIRLPYRFSEDLFAHTSLGTRVIVTDEPVEPQSFAHPRLFAALPRTFAAVSPGRAGGHAGALVPSANAGEVLKVANVSVADAGRDAASAAPRSLDEALAERRAKVATTAADIPLREVDLRAAEAALAAAEAGLRATRKALKVDQIEHAKAWKSHARAESARQIAARQLASFSRQLARDKARIAARGARRLADQIADTMRDRPIADVMERAAERARAAGQDGLALERGDATGKALQARSDALAAKEQEARAALDARKQALAAREAALKAANRNVPERQAAVARAKTALADARTAHERSLAVLNNFDAPATILVSRKLKSIFIRQGQAQTYQGPAEFVSPATPVGTHVYTAMRARGGTSREFEWRMTTVAKAALPFEPRRRMRAASMDDRPVVSAITQPATAETALERLQLGATAVARIGEVMRPGTTLIVSDDGPSAETSPFTDLIVQPNWVEPPKIDD
jgi:hypothetical protein